MSFAAHDNRKLSEVMLFAQESEQMMEAPKETDPVEEVPQEAGEKEPAEQSKPVRTKSIFSAGNSLHNLVKDNLRLLQWVNITSKFTKRND